MNHKLIILNRNLNSNSSIHQSYYSTLPKSLNSCPIFWSDDDLCLLLGSYLLIQIEDRKVINTIY